MGLLVNGHNTTSSENLSGFVHTIWHFSDNFSLTAGVRYSTDQEGRGLRQLDRRDPARHRREPRRLESGHRLQVRQRHDDLWLGGHRLSSAGLQPAAVPADAVRAGGWRRGDLVRARLQERLRGQPRARQPRRLLRRLQPAHPAGGRHRVHACCRVDRRRTCTTPFRRRRARRFRTAWATSAWRSLRARSTTTSRRRFTAPSSRCSSRPSRA